MDNKRATTVPLACVPEKILNRHCHDGDDDGDDDNDDNDDNDDILPGLICYL